ncbi:EnvZ/OmpR regulon moderator MzrA [Rosenbergiella australiborealis]|uniref:EnvZ/OmpR regulon moderator MzrA n=1 Tax=Rosenbergiella australiborealis TaxID=1544696 RepID=A0ABS5T3M3_9GAMM|nr:EnvZ/OmpR regulon moderator MzrA [Rosenbergiella australiborealis]MBT0726090.1 EnvZ/OmpR regulon moderator MzrA [Rosenbergiella australiborealis]
MRIPLIHSQRQLIFGTVIFLILLTVGVFAYQHAWQAPEAVVKINVTNRGISLPDGFFLYQHLSAEGITIKSITSGSDSLVISFNSTEDSRAAEKVLKRIFDDSYRIE